MKAGKSMRELREGGELKTFFDRRLIKALGHPVREHILAVLNERVASAREIGEELGADVSSFYHHIELLEELGCIERIASRRKRGATEHFFKARQTFFFDVETLQKIPASLKAQIAASSLQYVFDDVVLALKAGTLDARDDRHLSWTPGAFDAQGWRETTELMGQTLSRLGAIQEGAALRLSQGAAQQLNASVAILAYETPGERPA
jgi:DNA-binding transcriptional ArsR family regulator